MGHLKERIIEPRAATPIPGQTEVRRSNQLPDDLLSEHVKRLSVFAAVGGGLWSYGLVMDTVVAPLTIAAVASRIAIAIEVAGILTSLLMFLYARYARHSASVKTDAGLVYMILSAVGVATMNTFTNPVPIASLGHLSWNTAVILISSMIVPASPRRMLAAALVAATTDPAAVAIAQLRGADVRSFVDSLVLFTPNYACAIVAVLPSHVLQRLGRRLREAQEMGSYHLVELLGRGGMGEVWLARHRLLARNAAIKLVRPELLGASSEGEARTMLRRFEREAQATAALSSPHTIHLFDFGVTADRTFYYVMELLTGRDLESLVREFGPVPAERALFLLRQVCHSLADAHARGLVHRDVTPANIYVCRMGLQYDFVKVLDFGLVKFNHPAAMEQTLMTGAHTTTGTPAFMAPEIILDGAVDQRADVYALGCVAYFLLTGQLVFEADTPMKMFIQHLQSSPMPPSQRTELPIPPEVDALVLRCLEKDPSRRPQNAEELLHLIDRCRMRTPWNDQSAKAWWQQHLSDLTGPLTVADVDAAAADLPRAVSGRSDRMLPETMARIPAALSA